MIYKGSTVRLWAQIMDGDTGTLIDPPSVTFRIKNPAASVTSYVYNTDVQVARAAAGTYTCDVEATSAGTWTWRVETLDGVKGAYENTFTVTASAVV